MCKLKLRDYQQDIVDSKEKKILCNWSRGLGKNHTIISKIIKDRPNSVVWCGNFNNVVNTLKDLTKDHKKGIKAITERCDDVVEIVFQNNPNTTTCIYQYKRGVKTNPDLLVFNDMLPIDYVFNDIDAKQVISMVTTYNHNRFIQNKYKNYMINEQGINTIKRLNMCDHLEKLKDNSFYYSEIDICKEYEMNFFEQTIEKLQEEYNNINPSKDNVMTRQNLLKMIIETDKRINK